MNKNNIKIAFDIDGTTLNTYKTIKKYIEQDFNCKLNGNEWKIPNKTRSEVGDIINDYIKKYSYEMIIYNDILKFIEILNYNKIDFKFVSARPIFLQTITNNSLKYLFNKQNIDINNKHIICSGDKINKLSNSLDCNYFYEDTEKFSKFLSENNKNIIVFQIDRKSNNKISKITNNYFIINNVVNTVNIIL